MIKKIDVNELRIGMFICNIEGSWMDTPFLSHRFRIRSQRQIDKLVQCCQYVSIDTDRGLAPSELNGPEKQPQNPVVTSSRRDNNSTVGKPKQPDAHLPPYRALYNESRSILNNIFKDVRLGKSLDSGSARRVVEELTTSVVADANAMLYLAQLKDKGNELAQKSVNVCILTLIFGKHIGIPRKKMHALGLGGLLHDIGMVDIPANILCKPQGLIPDERKLVEKHPETGAAILARSADIPEETLDVVRSHHERMDGKGYPRGLKGRETSLFSRMVAITSVYEALTRERFYKNAISPTVALRRLYNWRHKDLDGRLVEKFIHALGIYPTGCLVETSGGEIAIVIATNEEDRLRPVLELVLDARLKPFKSRKYLDLSSTDAAGTTIRSTLDPGDPRVCEFIQPVMDEFR